MDKITLITLNVNGMTEKTKRQRIFALLLAENPSIIFLTETHILAKDIDKIKTEWSQMGGTNAIFEPTTVGSSMGVAILFGKNFTSKISNIKRSIPGRSLSAEVDILGCKHKLLNIYAPNIPARRREFFEAINNSESTRNKVIWGGDFNCVEDLALDRNSGNSTHLVGATEIKAFKEVHGLIDPFRALNPNTQIFTFTARNTTQLVPPRARLDRFYLPKGNGHMAQNDAYFVQNIPFTDHDMVISKYTPPSISPKNRRGRPIWKFNVQLLEDELFVQKTNELLDQIIPTESDFDNILEFWESLKGQVKMHASHYGVEKKRRDREVLQAAETELASLNKDDPLAQGRIKILEDGIANLRKYEIDLLLLQNKLDQIEIGEQPSLYFFKRLQHRVETSTLTELTNDQGQVLTDQSDILSEAQKFYKKLYTEEGVDNMAQNDMLQNLDKTISPESYNLLERDLELSELQEALKNMANGKTPGLDGICCEFYKKFAAKLLPILLKVSRFCENEGMMSYTQKQALISLIFKEKGEKSDLKNWRPISLLCVDYKIITKALAARLQNTLAEIIHPNQTAGIPGRSIDNNLWAIRDVIDHATENFNPTIMLSLDQEKAFDRVNHNFLLRTLQKFGFGPKFRNWIKVLYTDCSSHVQNNGHLSSKISIQRGIRQGCPISCFLYILTAENLAQAIRKDPQIHGYVLPRPSTDELKVSQYADDTVCLIRYEDHIPSARDCTRTSLQKLKETLATYERASGSKLNMAKTQIRIFGAIDSDNDITNYTMVTDFNRHYQSIMSSEASAIDDGIEILGIHFYTLPSIRFQKNFSILCEKMRKKLNFLSTRKLSIKGRVIALNTLVLAKLWYKASVITMTNHNENPIGAQDYRPLLDEINSLIYNYIWQNSGSEPVAREVLSLPVNTGGLGVINVARQALALRTKQITQALKDEPNPLPSQVFARVHLVKLNRRDSSGILHLFKPYTAFLEQYRAQPPPIRRTPGFDNPNYKSLDGLAHKISHLYADITKPPSCNKVYHQLSRDGIITIAGDNKWREVIGLRPPRGNEWRALNPFTEKEKLWRVRHFILNPVDRIDSLSRNRSNHRIRTCPLCTLRRIQNPQFDTHLHCLFDCPTAHEVWQTMGPILNRVGHPKVGPLMQKYLILGVAGNDKRSKIVNTIIIAIISQLWKIRNAAKHDAEVTSAATSVAKICKKVKKAISNFFLIAKRNRAIQKFSRELLVPALFTINAVQSEIIFTF